ncbi:hypothetical protein WSM22_19230 [Cytophagales bacterium WSM2-2]|nr:hypothetical protein WSM22_19230 [Cytophagales bacterium WSM2-2]
MRELRDLLGKKLKAVSFSTSFEGHKDYSKDERVDFDYLPLGGLTLLFEDETIYCVADYFLTSLGTSGVGVKRLDSFKMWPNSEDRFEKWDSIIGKELRTIKLYWNEESWNNGMKNQSYPESIELVFENHSLFYFCGDVDDYNPAENQYNLLTGRDTGIIFYNVGTFGRYNLNKDKRVEEITALQQST